MAASAVIAIKNLCKDYETAAGTVPILKDISLVVEEGESVAVMGPSGSGKSTLMNILGCLDIPSRGRYLLDGHDVAELDGDERARLRNEVVGFVFQGFNLLPRADLVDNVALPLLYGNVPAAERRKRATATLARVGLSGFEHYYPSQVSGGQQQRVAIARALAQNPPIVIADEPTAHLDYIQVEGVLRLIRDIATIGRLVVVATHDERITQLADHVVELAQHAKPAPPQPVPVHLEPGDVLFRQGDASDLVYTVDAGSIEIYRELADGNVEVLMDVGAGGYFGELGPMLNMPRSASARATEPCELTGYDVKVFRTEVLDAGR